MTTLLQRLVEYAWIFYAACIIGVIIYVVRALAAQRERDLAMFTLERETATAQAIRAWLMVFVFVGIGTVVFASTTFVLPALSDESQGTPTPTTTPVSGVILPERGNTTPSPTLGSVVLSPTPTSLPTLPPATSTPSPPAESPTPSPTDTPAPAITGEVYARFGDFAELVGYSLSSTTVSKAQSLQLTLYWRGVDANNQANYLVFTHLLSTDGQLIAQHDGAPAGGSRPTSSWQAGETIVDLHPMSFYETDYTGPARIAVGLYDPASGRVSVGTTENDAVVLPVTIDVVP